MTPGEACGAQGLYRTGSSDIMQQVLNAVSERSLRYDRAEISQELAATDVMYTGSMAHYLAVGRSAIGVIARAMLLTEKTEFSSVLDLPCGGGRVTRHLIKLLPDAELFVSDLDKGLEDFTVNQFGGTTIDAGRDFDVAPPRSFDLIFVGSLVTHLDAPMFERALNWFTNALSPEGVLVLTTAGRRAEFLQRTVIRYSRSGQMGDGGERLHGERLWLCRDGTPLRTDVWREPGNAVLGHAACRNRPGRPSHRISRVAMGQSPRRPDSAEARHLPTAPLSRLEPNFNLDVPGRGHYGHTRIGFGELDWQKTRN